MSEDTPLSEDTGSDPNETMRGPRIFFQGGEGGANWPYGQPFFLVLNLFYSLQRKSNGFITEKTTIPRI